MFPDVSLRKWLGFLGVWHLRTPERFTRQELTPKKLIEDLVQDECSWKCWNKGVRILGKASRFASIYIDLPWFTLKTGECMKQTRWGISPSKVPNISAFFNQPAAPGSSWIRRVGAARCDLTYDWWRCSFDIDFQKICPPPLIFVIASLLFFFFNILLWMNYKDLMSRVTGVVFVTLGHFCQIRNWALRLTVRIKHGSCFHKLYITLYYSVFSKHKNVVTTYIYILLCHLLYFFLPMILLYITWRLPAIPLEVEPFRQGELVNNQLVPEMINHHQSSHDIPIEASKYDRIFTSFISHWV